MARTGRPSALSGRGQEWSTGAWPAWHRVPVTPQGGWQGTCRSRERGSGHRPLHRPTDRVERPRSRARSVTSRAAPGALESPREEGNTLLKAEPPRVDDADSAGSTQNWKQLECLPHQIVLLG